jgi:hemerythrin superfamily protein
MNIDERLEKLTERHEAMAQTVELLTKDVQQTSNNVKRLGKYVRSVMQIVLDHETRLRAMEGNGDESDEAEEQ